MIELAADLALDPSEAVTQTYGAIASKGGGKSYLGQKFAEGLYDAGAPFVVLDPVGNWSALTLGADGQSPGLSVVVIGGDRADIPLDVEHADRLGTFLVSQGLQAVVDLSELSKKRRKEYVADLCESIYREARSQRSPFMVIFEEAQVFAPQQCPPGEQRMLGAVTDIVRLGRNYGLGAMLITQRPQSVSKEVLNQVECLFVGQLRGPQERKAIAGWVTEQGAAIAKDAIAELPSLSPGDFCAWSPSWLRVFKRIRILPKRTYDGSSTPKLGASRAASVKSQRDIGDVVRLLERLFESKNGPTDERGAGSVSGSFEAEAERLAAEVEQLMDRAERAEQRARHAEKQLETVGQSAEALGEALKHIRESSDRVAQAIEIVRDALRRVSAEAPTAAPRAPMPEPVRQWSSNPPGPLTKRPPKPEASQLGVRPVARESGGGAKGGGALDKPATAILGVLAQQRGAIPKARLALLAGYSPTGGAFNNCLSRLRVAEWIEGSRELSITRAGRAVAPKVAPLPTGEALIEHWRRHPRMDTPMRAIFEQLVSSLRPLTKEQIGQKTGYSSTAGAFNNALSRLRVLGLVHGKGKEPLRLDPTLEEAAKEAA